MQIVGRVYGKYGRKKGEEEDQRAVEVEDEEEGQLKGPERRK